MTTRSRILLALAALMLGLAYVLPLWRVSLEAPQYPGGIGMQIWIDTVTGLNPHDLQNINGLNHYIGMQAIVPDSIPELDLMPWLFGGLIVLGLLGATLGKRWGLYVWTGLFALLLAVGFVDYYKWGYDYGHNLSPDAAIKIPGMAYQPPLVGSKQMLNFVAHSWPDTGGFVIFVAFALAVVTSVLEFRRRRTAAAVPTATTGLVVATVLAVGLLAGCEPGPQPIRYGEDVGAYCRMTISDPRFGAELVTTTGKTFKFDSIECLTGFVAEHPEVYEAAHSVWVVPFDAPGTLIPVAEAHFLQSAVLPSPMGGGLAAYTTAAAREAARTEKGGAALDWAAVLTRDGAEGMSTHAVHVR